MRRFLVAAILVCAPSVANALNTWGTDMSDLWWNPNESGWGINIAHHLAAETCRLQARSTLSISRLAMARLSFATRLVTSLVWSAGVSADWSL